MSYKFKVTTCITLNNARFPNLKNRGYIVKTIELGLNTSLEVYRKLRGVTIDGVTLRSKFVLLKKKN